MTFFWVKILQTENFFSELISDMYYASIVMFLPGFHSFYFQKGQSKSLIETVFKYSFSLLIIFFLYSKSVIMVIM